MVRGDRRKPCPHCSTGDLGRIHTASWLRAFRVIRGLYPRSYMAVMDVQERSPVGGTLSVLRPEISPGWTDGLTER